MTNDEVIKGFYNHLQEIEGGLKNLKYKLGDEYEDAKQNALIRLYKHNEKNGIEPTMLKGLCFITLKNCCITMVQRNKVKYNTESLDDVFNVADNTNNEFDGLNEFDSKLREKILIHISQDEYNLMLKYYSDRYDRNFDEVKIDKAVICNLKRIMGFNKYYILTDEDGTKTKFNHLAEISRHIGCDNTYLSKSLKNNLFTYAGKRFKVELIGSIANEKNKIKRRKK